MSEVVSRKKFSVRISTLTEVIVTITVFSIATLVIISEFGKLYKENEQILNNEIQKVAGELILAIGTDNATPLPCQDGSWVGSGGELFDCVLVPNLSPGQVTVPDIKIRRHGRFLFSRYRINPIMVFPDENFGEEREEETPVQDSLDI
jgi:type II secretory pathway pseudopilin PulG